MKNEDSKKLAVGLLIGGAVGAMALYYMKRSSRQPPLIQRVGKTISHVGEMLENCDVDCTSLANRVEEHLPKKTTVVRNAVDWIEMGFKLWKNLKH